MSLLSAGNSSNQINNTNTQTNNLNSSSNNNFNFNFGDEGEASGEIVQIPETNNALENGTEMLQKDEATTTASVGVGVGGAGSGGAVQATRGNDPEGLYSNTDGGILGNLPSIDTSSLGMNKKTLLIVGGVAGSVGVLGLLAKSLKR